MIIYRLAAVVATVALSTGCVLVRTHEGAQAWRAGVHTMAVLPAVEIKEVQAGGVAEEQEEWSAQAQARLVAEVKAELETRHIAVRAVKPKGDPELEEAVLLFEEVRAAIMKFTYGPYANDYKVRHFEYSVGDLSRPLAKAGADSLLMIWAVGEVSTTGRRITSPLHLDGSGVYMAAFDRSGTVIWFDAWGGVTYDLRDPQAASSLVKTVLKSFPGSRP